MLRELRIQNFAIIDQLDLQLAPTLVVLTGETGAGKSILIDAVEVLLGGRVDAAMIRAETDTAFVEGTFKIQPDVQPAVHRLLLDEDLLDDQEYVTLAREIRKEGRNVARVNGRTVNVSLLKALGELLVDVHGQSQHLSLLRVRFHLDLLDRYAEAGDALAAYKDSYRELAVVRRELTELRQSEQDAAQRSEMLTFQINEIESARLQTNEDEDLRTERDRLANAESLASSAQEALTLLDESASGEPIITDLLGQVVADLENLGKVDTSQTRFGERAQGLSEGVYDLVHGLRAYLEEIEFNPRRLEQVEERVDLINRLKRKYGGSIETVLAFKAQARGDMDAITNAEERITELEGEEARLLTDLAAHGQALSSLRREAAERLGQAVETELDDLRMAEARFGVDFRQEPDPDGIPLEDGRHVAFDENGLEQVEFMVAPNPGEGLKPLVKIASGGETSRLMLALKNVLARADQTPTLIFDEIDQGIGGRVGAIVGQKLWNLAKRHQVLCVTHLPQLAGYGQQHYRVQKVVDEGRTHTQVEGLEAEERLMELAQMLGELSEGTLQSANEIMQSVGKATGGE